MLALTVAIVAAPPSCAQASWPADAAWIPYTRFGDIINDLSSAQGDNSWTSNPGGADDIVSGPAGTLPSVYYYYDGAYLFMRQRINGDPRVTIDLGSANGPYVPIMWNMLIDIDGDGYKEFTLVLNGDSGKNQDPIDDLEVFYNNSPTQIVNPATDRVWRQDSNVRGSVPRTAVTDFGYSRVTDPTASGGNWFIDWQVPMTAFYVGGVPLITGTTPIALGFTSSTSNTNPLQKDLAYEGTLRNPDPNDPYPYGDPITLGSGPSQAPQFVSLTATGCGPTTVSATVIDTLRVVGGVVQTTVASVAFYYQPDANGDGTPDVGSTPVLIGTATSPIAGSLSVFQVPWNTPGTPPLFNGYYDIFAVATDIEVPAHVTTSWNIVFELKCGVPTGHSVSGYVYNDADHSSTRTTGEAGTGVTPLYVKIVRGTETTARAAAAVDPTTGAYSLNNIIDGTYRLVLDNNNTLSDITPYLPPGWVGTENPTQVITGVVMNGANVVDQNFGLYRGSRISGSVFQDDGTGTGGVANDGVRNGTEAGLGEVTVTLTSDDLSTTYGTTQTDATGTYTLWVPFSVGSSVLRVTEANLSGYISTGGSVGNTSGTYTRATDTTRFTNSPGMAYSGVDFGDVPANTFVPDGQQTAPPATAVYFAHVFTSGSAGSVTFSATQVDTPDVPGWNPLIYHDTNGNGLLDAGEPLLTAPLAMAAGDEVRIIVKDFVPANAPIGAYELITVVASFQYTNATPALAGSHTVTDLITVVDRQALTLVKSVDKEVALPGETITYTLTYRNDHDLSVSDVVIIDTTPGYTTFVSASYSTPLPIGLTACTVAAPAVGGTGTVSWTFTGTLAPGQSGSVSYQVKVD